MSFVALTTLLACATLTPTHGSSPDEDASRGGRHDTTHTIRLAAHEYNLYLTAKKKAAPQVVTFADVEKKAAAWHAPPSSTCESPLCEPLNEVEDTIDTGE